MRSKKDIKTKEQNIAARNNLNRLRALKQHAEGRGKPCKWNHKSLISMHMAGMTYKDIISTPEFAKLPQNTWRCIVYGTNRIKGKRKKHPTLVPAIQQNTVAIVRDLSVKMKDAAAEHYEFFLDQINQERQIIVARLKTTDISDQKGRMALLADMEALTAKVLKLEDMPKMQDPNKNSVNIMVNLQQSRPVNRFERPSAPLTLVDQTNDLQTPSQGRNGHRSIEADCVIVEDRSPTTIPDRIASDIPEVEGLGAVDQLADDTLELLRTIRAQKKG